MSEVLQAFSAILVILATFGLILALGLLAKHFGSLGLANKEEALGLPAGSVRALIALFLLLAFVVMSLYVFQEVNKGRESEVIENVTQEEITFFRSLGNNVRILRETTPNATPATTDTDIPTTTEKMYSITLVEPLNDTASQLALQIFTILGTLVGTISGFYFGTRSLETAGRVLNPSTDSDDTLSSKTQKPEQPNLGQT